MKKFGKYKHTQHKDIYNKNVIFTSNIHNIPEHLNNLLQGDKMD